MPEGKYLKYVIIKRVLWFYNTSLWSKNNEQYVYYFQLLFGYQGYPCGTDTDSKGEDVNTHLVAFNMAKKICIFYCLRMCIVMYMSQENIQIKLIWNHNGLKFILKYICIWYIILEECINNVFYLFSWFYFLFCRTFVLRNTRVCARSCATSS